MPILALPFPVDQSRPRSVGSVWPFAGTRSPISPGWSLGWWLIRRVVAERPLLGRRDAPDRGRASTTCWSIARFGVIIGGRLGNVLFYDPGYYFAHPLDIFKVWEGGMAFHGGLIGAFVGMSAVRPPLSRAGADRASISASLVAPIGIFFGRIANFIKPGALGPADRRALGDDLSRHGRPAAPSEPDLRGRCSKGCSPSSSCLRSRAAGALRRPGLIAGGFGVLYGAGAHLLRVLPRSRSAARGPRAAA